MGWDHCFIISDMAAKYFASESTYRLIGIVLLIDTKMKKLVSLFKDLFY